MKYSTIFTVISALLVGQAIANPIVKRTSCQVCSIKGLEAGDACCSASCLAQHGDIHGGHCDDKEYCICN